MYAIGGAMASVDELAALQRATDVAADDTTYTPVLLGSMFDAYGLNLAALMIWREKAAYYARMVTVSEGGSSRAMSDLQRQALEMVKIYERAVAADNNPATGDLDGLAYTVPIERV